MRFPSRAIAADGRLWVADSGHGRVLECTWSARDKRAKVLAEHDGFVEPRGLAQVDGRIYVADRAAHEIWRLGSGGESRVRVAGTGVLGSHEIAPGPADTVELRSPWGLAAAAGGRLTVAMAGTHQLWTLDPRTATLSLLAGTGGEDLGDGAATRATLAQPTGITRLSDAALAFADCESSAVRVLGGGSVATLVGTGLFDFGDRPGLGDSVLLQHCEDVASHRDVLVVADTYNDRLKRVDPITRECVAWLGEAGEKGSLREPGGVWSDGSTMLVADTGNHRIAVIEPDGAIGEVQFDFAST